MKPLSSRQKKFAENLSTGLVPLQAAIQAGYSKKYARARSHTLSANVGIMEYIKTITKPQADKHEVTRENLTKMLLDVIKDSDTSSLITGQKDLKSKIQAVIALSRMYGLNAAEVKEEYRHTILTIQYK